jgi:exonuclease SbcD
MSPDVFGDAYDYVALGHIHSMMRVGDSDSYYSGTPVPTRRVESKARYILDVTFNSDGREVEPVEVPTYRRIMNVEGDYEAIKDQLSDVEIESAYNPALFVRLDASDRKNIHELEVELESFLEEEFNDAERPRIADLEIYRSERDDGLEAEHHVEDPDELDPVEMFERLYDKEHPGDDGPPEELMSCYETVLEEVLEEKREENSE